MTSKEFERFIKRVIVLTNDEEESHKVCWQWTGWVKSTGYGGFTIDGKDLRAHRVMYEHCYGKLDNNLVVHHTCHNKLCVSPFHLVAITQTENAREGRTRTTCKRGHELVDGNLYYYIRNGTPQRTCRTCVRERYKNAPQRLVNNMTDEQVVKLLEEIGGGDEEAQ